MIEKLKEILRHRQLIFTLVSRELKARYRGTVLGFFWSLFNPLLLMLVYTVVFGFIVGGGRVAGFRQHQVSTPCSCSTASCPGPGFPPRCSSRPMCSWCMGR